MKIWSGRLLAGAVLLCAGIPGAASASQLLIAGPCSFVIEVPTLFGSSKQEYNVAGGAVFSPNDSNEYCGPVSQNTPFGVANANNCFHVAGGAFVSDSYSSKISSSTCYFSDAAAFNTPYRDADFAAWNGKGTASLHGQAFLKTVGGDVKTCAGADVAILPDNPYMEELIAKWTANVSADADPRALALLHKTICDAQGNFSFTSLPAQRWFVLTTVTWGVPHIERPGERPGALGMLIFGFTPPPASDQQGGELMQSVVLQAGDNQVFLTDRDLR